MSQFSVGEPKVAKVEDGMLETRLCVTESVVQYNPLVANTSEREHRRLVLTSSRHIWGPRPTFSAI